MKYFLALFLLCLPFLCFAQDYEGYQIDNINITTNRLNPAVAARKFKLKSGDIITKEDYEKAQDELHNMRVFRTLDFEAVIKEDKKVDINIKGQDGYFVFPLFFFVGSGKNAAAISITEGNYFKRGETAFAFAAISSDGVTANAGLAVGDSFFSAGFTKLNFDQRFYADGWSSNYGVLSTADDKDKYGDPLWTSKTKQTHISLLYAYKMDIFSAFIRPEFEKLYYEPQIDNGNHNRVTFGFSLSDNMPQGSNMGAAFGLGLSDKAKALRNLEEVKYGYNANVFYTNGGEWTGADYDIQKFGGAISLVAELKQRHMLLFTFKAQEALKAPFSDNIRSVDLLGGFGAYNRQILGSRGAGVSTAFRYYILRNNTGLLSLEPFYELAYIYNNKYVGRYLNHSGTGATLSYKFWRFPFPIGLNYTHNLSDSSNKVALSIGGNF